MKRTEHANANATPINPMPDDRPVSPEERQPRKLAQEVRDILRASAYFDPTSRIYSLVNALESFGLSVETERDDLRAALSAPAGPPVSSDDANESNTTTDHEEAVEARQPDERDVKLVAYALDGVCDSTGRPMILRERQDLARGALLAVALSAARPSSPTPEETLGTWRDDMGNVFEAECLTPDGYRVEGTITWAPRVGEGTEPWSVRTTLLPLNYERIEASSATPGDDATTKEGRTDG